MQVRMLFDGLGESGRAAQLTSPIRLDTDATRPGFEIIGAEQRRGYRRHVEDERLVRDTGPHRDGRPCHRVRTAPPAQHCRTVGVRTAARAARGDEMVRSRLTPGAIPSLPELYPGEKSVESIEISHEADSTSLQEADAGSSFLDTGRITLEVPATGARDTADDDG
jgi:hypothetical protein